MPSSKTSKVIYVYIATHTERHTHTCVCMCTSTFKFICVWILIFVKYVLHFPFSQIQYLQIFLLAKIYLQSSNQYLQHFHGSSRTHTEQKKDWVTWHAWSQMRLKTETLIFLVYLCFLMLIFLFKMAPDIVLKNPMAFLSTIKLWCALQRKQMCAVISYSAVDSEFSVNE